MQRSRRAAPWRQGALAFERLEDRTLLAADLAWVAGFGSAGVDQAVRVATDAAGNVYATGLFSGTVDFDPGPGISTLSSGGPSYNTFVAKYDPDGLLVWAKSFDSTGESQGNGLAVDADGNVAVTGSFRGQIDLDPGIGVHSLNSAGGQDVFVVKLDGAGDFLWGQRIGAGGDDVGSALAFDADGDLNVGGHFGLTVDFDPGAGTFTQTASPVWQDAFLLKLDTAGDFVRAASFGGTGTDGVKSIATDAAGNLAIAGEFGGVTSGTLDADPGPGVSLLTSSGGNDAYLIKLDSDWNLLWAGQVGGSGDDGSSSVALSADGTAYMTGLFRGTADFSFGTVVEQRTATGGIGDAFVVKVGAGGDLEWVQVFHGDTNTSGNAVVLDAAGNVYTAGAFIGTVDFDPGPDTLSLTSGGFVDGYLVKLDSNGAFISALVSPSGPGEDIINGLALDADGSIFVAAHFQNSATIGSGDSAATLTSNGSYDGAIFKLSQQPDLVGVEIDVKPGSDPNSVNLASNGVIAVAVYTTDDFDASSIDVGTVLFAGATATQSALEDLDGDGDLDLILHFRTQETNLRSVYEQLIVDDVDADGILDSNKQQAEVSLTGQTVDDVAFEGLDTLDLFLSGKNLREMLEQLAADGLI
jgi:hypothetical protein